MTSTQHIYGGLCALAWSLLYIVTSGFIKSSICTTLKRVASQKIYTKILLVVTAIMTVVGAGSIAVYVQALAECSSVAIATGAWSETCISPIMFSVQTIVFSTVNVLTDLLIAIMPIFMVWNLQSELIDARTAFRSCD